MSIKKKIFYGMTASLVALVLFSAIMTYHQIRKRTIENYIDKSQSILLNGEIVLLEMGKKYDLGLFGELNNQKNIEQVMEAVPVITAMHVMEKGAEGGNYEFKVPKFEPRNSKNQPSLVEKNILTEIKDKNLPGYIYLDDENNSLRVFRPIRLMKSCLLCHGDPKLSKDYWGRNDGRDITGGKMENWKEGEIHGAFEVISSLDPADKAVWNSILVIFIPIIVLLIITVFLVNSIINKSFGRIKKVIIKSKEIAKFDFREKVPKENEDEIGELADAFNHMVSNLSEIVLLIMESSERLNSSSMEVSQGAENVSEGAQNQAATIEEISASVEEMSGSIHGVSELSFKSNQLAEKTFSLAESGKQIIQNQNHNMGEISNSSKEISKIIETITSIASQTHLLALNATVEAARAGEQGKGFSVVASEIRKLAESVSDASAEIRELIKNSILLIQRGDENFSRLQNSFEEILINIKETKQSVNQIARASSEQSLTSNEVAKAVTNITSVVEQNSYSSEQLASSSHVLVDLSNQLNSIVERFKL